MEFARGRSNAMTGISLAVMDARSSTEKAAHKAATIAAKGSMSQVQLLQGCPYTLYTRYIHVVHVCTVVLLCAYTPAS